MSDSPFDSFPTTKFSYKIMHDFVKDEIRSTLKHVLALFVRSKFISIEMLGSHARPSSLIKMKIYFAAQI